MPKGKELVEEIEAALRGVPDLCIERHYGHSPCHQHCLKAPDIPEMTRAVLAVVERLATPPALVPASTCGCVCHGMPGTQPHCEHCVAPPAPCPDCAEIIGSLIAGLGPPSGKDWRESLCELAAPEPDVQALRDRVEALETALRNLVELARHRSPHRLQRSVWRR